MPAISMFYGVIIYMYFYDNKKHKLPHIELMANSALAVKGERVFNIDPLK